MSQLPDTRQGMVSLAQRIFEGMRNRRQGRIRDDQKEKTERERPNRGGFRGRGRGNHGRYNGTSRKPGQPADSQSIESGNKCPSGINDKGENACFKCGSGKHFARDCPKKEPKEKDPKV